jgi:hypothetical protein
VVAGVGEDDPVGHERVVLAEGPRDAGEQRRLAVLPGALADGDDVVVWWVAGGSLPEFGLHPGGDLFGQRRECLVPVGVGGVQVKVATCEFGEQEAGVVWCELSGAEVDDAVRAVEQVWVGVEQCRVGEHDAAGQVGDRVELGP